MKQLMKLGDIVSFRTGKLNSNAAVEDGEYPFFTCSQETYRINTFAFDTECVLLAGNNANGIYPLKYFKGKFDAYQRTYVIEPLVASRLSIRYLYYVLTLKLAYLRQLSTGAATKFLTLTILRDIDLNVPKIEEQCRIVNILSGYDDLIENNNRRIAILEEMTRKVYEEWCVEFRFPGHEQVKLVESSLGILPEGWMPKRLGDLAFETRDNIQPGAIDASTPYVGLEHIPRRSLALYDWGRAGDVQSTKLRFVKDDILFGKIRPYFHKVSVAPLAGVASSDAIVIRPKEEGYFSLVLAVVSSDAFVAQATQSSNGTKMPRANWSVLVEYPVPLPTEDLLSTFNKFVRPAISQIQALTMKNRNLRATRDLLLPRLISGELDVSTLTMPEEAVA